MKRHLSFRAVPLIVLMLIITTASTRLRADTGICGGASITLPFTDVPSSNVFFCSIAEAFFSGLTNGTTATTYNPSDPVPREQMAALVTRTMDQSLKRGSRRAALDQYWTPTSTLRLTSLGGGPSNLVKSDGADLWVANGNTVIRVRASDGKLLETWTGVTNAYGVIAAGGLIFLTGSTNPGVLYQIIPTQTAGPVATLTSALGMNPQGIAFDGTRIWTANAGNGSPASGSVSIVSLNPVMVTTVTTGFASPQAILYDGANMWVTDNGTSTGKLFKLDSAGNILLTVTMGQDPEFAVFDGTNIWIPNESSNNLMVVRASTGTVIATLNGNGLSAPLSAAFDGERILVTNFEGNSVSLWKATDLTPLGSINIAPAGVPLGACSDGLNFWVTLNNTAQLARF